MSNIIRVILKVIGLATLLAFLYFLAMLVFLATFGEGGQASDALNSGGFAALLLYTTPLLIVVFIAYRTFRKKHGQLPEK